MSQHFAHTRISHLDEAEVDANAADEEDEEAAWLQSVQKGDMGDVTAVKGLRAGDLVLDMSQLRSEPATSASAVKRSLKGNLPQ